MTKSADLERYSEAASEALAALRLALGRADPGPETVAALVAHARLQERQLVGLLVCLEEKAQTHAAAGIGRPVEEVLADGKSVSDATVYRDRMRARMAQRFPEVGLAAAAGDVFPENLDVLARITGRMTSDEVKALVERDGELAKAAVRLGQDSFRKKVQRYRNKIRDDNGTTAERQARAEECASVSVSRDNQTHRVHAVFDTMHGTAVATAHRLEYRRLCDDLGSGHGLTSDQISAQALHDLIVRGGNMAPTAENNQPTVVLHVLTDGRTLTKGPHEDSIVETTDGLTLSPGTLGQIACDCVIQRIDSLPDGDVKGSRSSRTATPTQRAALRALYDKCPIGGAPWSQIEVHHVRFASHGGETELANLIPISRRWHHLIHDSGWTLEMDADRTLQLSRPDGTHDRTIPPPVPVLHGRDSHTGSDSDSDDHALAA